VRLRRSTRVWLILWVAATLAWIVIGRVAPDAGCLRIIALSVAWAAGLVLLWRLSLAAFRLIVHRLTLRLAFSYFLIGIVPIPLLAVLLGAVGYLFAHQYMANRLRREITAIGEAAARTQAGLPTLRGDSAGTLVRSDVPWLRPDEKTPWLLGLERPGFLVSERDVWLVAPSGKGQAVVLRLTDPSASALQELADRTGYTVGVERGESAQKRGITIQTAPKKRDTETRVRSETLTFLNQAGIDAIDPLPALQAVIASGINPYPETDPHPMAPGYEALARAVATRLRHDGFGGSP